MTIHRTHLAGHHFTGHFSLFAPSHEPEFAAAELERLESRTLFSALHPMEAMPLQVGAAAGPAAPVSVTATYQAGTGITVRWREAVLTNITGFTLQRATDGVHFSSIATITDPTTVSYLDTDLATGTMFTYRVQAIAGLAVSPMSAVARYGTAVLAPTDLQATPAPKSVALTWTNNDTHAVSNVVWRSTDNRTYTAVATLGGAVSTWTDTKVNTASRYYYRVVANNGSCPAGKGDILTTTTLVMAPSNVAASISGTKVRLIWADGNRAGMTYSVLRSADGGETFQPVAAIAAGTLKYTDNSVDPDTDYIYKVQAIYGSASSLDSPTVTISTPEGTPTIAITTRYGNELVVSSYGATDTIAVSQSDTTITLTLNGQTFTEQATAAGLFIYDRGGADSIDIDASVAVRTTITSLGTNLTPITSAAANVSAWIDSTDLFTGQGVVHSIATLWGNVSKAVSAALVNPKDAGAVTKQNKSLWGTGPVETDVNQGSVGDCYFLATLAGAAHSSAMKLQESAVDMGDGTYIVQYAKGGRTNYLRVSNDLSNGNWGGYRYAHPGANNTIWAPIMEKAYTYFRSGAYTYASINSGWMGEVYSAIGIPSANLYMNQSESSFYSTVSADLAAGRAVTFGTTGIAPSLVRGHAYTLVSASIDENGVTHYTVRNPWGFSGRPVEDSGGYAILTFSQMQANFSMGARAAA